MRSIKRERFLSLIEGHDTLDFDVLHRLAHGLDLTFLNSESSLPNDLFPKKFISNRLKWTLLRGHSAYVSRKSLKDINFRLPGN